MSYSFESNNCLIKNETAKIRAQKLLIMGVGGLHNGKEGKMMDERNTVPMIVAFYCTFPTRESQALAVKYILKIHL